MASKVYFIEGSISDGEQLISEKARKLFKAGGFAGCFEANDCTAVKVHVGEAGNNTYTKAPYLKGLVDELIALKTRPFVTDTTTLYVGKRHNAVDHTALAIEHGFCLDGLGIPFIVTDGLFGTSDKPIDINGEIDKQVYIASGIVQCRSMLCVAHLTGHVASCLGAAIKTLGMGCAGKRGKLKQHAALNLDIGDDCTRCGVCYEHCPADAIKIDDVKAHIDQDKCIGCAECMAVCKFGAVKCNWGQEDEVLQKSMAEHALGAVKSKEDKLACFNFVMSVTKDCDCFDTPDMERIVDDIGIAASRDPVAVDKATLDLVENKAGKKLANLIGNDKLDPRYQIEHAERIGLGTSSYELIEVH
jgi:hypothetical protein